MEEKSSSIQDIVMERPMTFKIGDSIFYIYPMTLGKMFLMQGILSKMGVDKDIIEKSAEAEMLRLTISKKEAVCGLLSYLTARNEYYDVFDVVGYERRKNILMTSDASDIASLLMLSMTADKTAILFKELGIDEEQKAMRKVMKVKDKSDKNSFTFGGVSIFGSLLDFAMERYKMTKRQVVWEIDYASLRLLLADRVNSIYVTDAERRKIHIPKDRTRVNGDDREAMMRAIQSQSWE